MTDQPAPPRRRAMKGTIAFITCFWGYLGWKSAAFLVTWTLDPKTVVDGIRRIVRSLTG